MPQAVIVTGPNGKVKDCYNPATSLKSDAELSEIDAKMMMEEQENCARNEAEMQLVNAYIREGMTPDNAIIQAASDIQAIGDYFKWYGNNISQADRIETYMNIAVGLATGAISLKDFQKKRDNAIEATNMAKNCMNGFGKVEDCAAWDKSMQNWGNSSLNLLRSTQLSLYDYDQKHGTNYRNTIARARASSESHIVTAYLNWAKCNKPNLQPTLAWTPNATLVAGLGVTANFSIGGNVNANFLNGQVYNANGGPTGKLALGEGAYAGVSLVSGYIGNAPSGAYVGNSTTLSLNVGIIFSFGISISSSDLGEFGINFVPPLPVNPGIGFSLTAETSKGLC